MHWYAKKSAPLRHETHFQLQTRYHKIQRKILKCFFVVKSTQHQLYKTPTFGWEKSKNNSRKIWNMTQTMTYKFWQSIECTSSPHLPLLYVQWLNISINSHKNSNRTYKNLVKMSQNRHLSISQHFFTMESVVLWLSLLQCNRPITIDGQVITAWEHNLISFGFEHT